MTGIILCDSAPEVTERAGLFIVETASGGDKIAVALTQRDICILAERIAEAVAEVTLRRQAALISFPAGQSKRKKSRKADASAKKKGG